MPRQPTALPLHILETGKMLAIASTCDGWLILKKPFYTELIGPGAAVGGSLDAQCQAAYIIGGVALSTPKTPKQRQHALQQRQRYCTILQEIAQQKPSSERARLLIQQLNEWLGSDYAQSISPELAAQLIGVLPETIAIAWQRYRLCLGSTQPSTAAEGLVG
jgi:hypothetical protein